MWFFDIFRATKKTTEDTANINSIPERHYNFTKVRKFVDDVVVIDFETTGLEPSIHEIIQIGAIKYENGEVIEEFSSYVRPSQPIPTRITKLTGITDNTVKGAPPLKDSLTKLNELISNNIIVAHNAKFDIKFLIENFERNNLEYGELKVIDTLILSRRHINNLENYKLVTLKNFLKIEANSHDALEDCKVTGSLYYYIKKMFDKSPQYCSKKHHSEYVEIIKELKRNNKNVEAVNLLLELVDAVEAQAKLKHEGPAPWYYEQLAILYRKEKQHEQEIKILERYFNTCRNYGIPLGVTHQKLTTRYEKLLMK